MKSRLLPLATTLGAVGSFTLMLATQAAPLPDVHPGAQQQPRQMEHQSRLREWSHGLGINLSGTAAVARTEKDFASAADAQPTPDRERAETGTADDEEQHGHAGKHDRIRNDDHSDESKTVS